MKHPSKDSESFEFNLGKAPELRCEKIATTCGQCEACCLGSKLKHTKDWFVRSGEKTKRLFVLGLVRRFHSFDLMQYVAGILQMGKDFNYTRSRSRPSRKEDQADMCADRALKPWDVEYEIGDTWRWFAESKYWTKANYILGLFHVCDHQLLSLVGNQARTMLVAEKRRLKKQQQATGQEKADRDDLEAESLASTSYTFESDDHPDTVFLKTVLSGNYSAVRQSPFRALEAGDSDLDDDYQLVEDEDEDEQYSERSSIEPEYLVLPKGSQAVVGVSGARDFIRELPVHLSKYILNMMDLASLHSCLMVSRNWCELVKQVHKELQVHQNLWEEVMLMQGSSAKGCNPVYAKFIEVAVPELGVDGNVIETGEPSQEVTFKSEASPQTCYSSVVTKEVQMEERNIYCGAYNVMVLSDHHQYYIDMGLNPKGDDSGRVVHYNSGQWVTLGSMDRKVRFLDVTTGVYAGPVVIGHAGSIRCVYIDENAEKPYVLSGSYDTSIRCWDLETGKCMKIFRGHQNTVTCLDVFGSRVASGGKDNAVKVWNFETRKCQRTFKHKHQIQCVNILNDRVVSGCEGAKVKVWCISTASLIKRLDGHHGPVQCVKMDDYHLVSGSSDGYVLAWSLLGNHKRLLAALRHPKEVLCVQMVYLRVITGCGDGKIRIWNLLKGDCLRVMRGNSRSDPIQSVICCGNRMLLNTVNNLLVFNFEEVDWDYTLDSDRIEILTYNNHYSDAPLRQHPYPYIRAQRSHKIFATNPKIIHHQDPETLKVLEQQQLSHSGQVLGRRVRMQAQQAQSLYRDVQLTRSLKGSLFYNIQMQRPATAGTGAAPPRSPAPTRPATSATARMLTSRPPTGMSRITTAGGSRPATSQSSRRPASLQSAQSRERTGVQGPEVGVRGHSAPAATLRRSEQLALRQSSARRQKNWTPHYQMLMTINAIEKSKNTTDPVMKNTLANSGEIDYRPPTQPPSEEVLRPARKKSGKAPPQPSASVSEVKTDSMVTSSQLEVVPIHYKNQSIHPKTLKSTIPRPYVIRPQTASGPTGLSADSTGDGAGLRPCSTADSVPQRPRASSHAGSSSTGGSTLSFTRRVKSAVDVVYNDAVSVSSQARSLPGARAGRKLTTSHMEPVVPVPMMMHGQSRIEPGATADGDGYIRSRKTTIRVVDSQPVKNPFDNQLVLHTWQEGEEVTRRVRRIQEKYVRQQAAQAARKQRGDWLHKAKGLLHAT